MIKALPTLFLAIIISNFSIAQEVTVIKYPELLEMMEQEKPSSLVIYNFWATWCAPCVKEMPLFEKANQNENVTIRFISLDDLNKLETRVVPFLKRKGIQSEVYLLDETDYNEFIDKVDKRWSGAIPATVLINHASNERLFFEKEFSEGELETVINNQLN